MIELMDETGTYHAMADLQQALEALGNHLQLQSNSFSLILLDDATIQSMNARDRAEDKATDVLSYPTWEPDDDAKGLGMPRIPYLGDIFISLDTASRQATQAGHSLEHEVKILAAHGLTHLLGHDHHTAEEWQPFLDNQQKILEY